MIFVKNLPLKKNANIVNLGNFENILEMKDPTISFYKRRTNNVYDNGIWILLDGKIYYFKEIKTITRLINDLLGVKVTEFFDLPSVHYKIARGFYNGTEIYGLISKYERNNNYQYKNLEDIVYSENSIIEDSFDIRNLSVLKAIENAYSETPLPTQLKKVLVRDLVTNEQDRRMSEIHIRENLNTIELDKIFDYEIEWNLKKDENGDDMDEINITQEDIDFNYRIPGLLTLTKESLPYIQSDPVFQDNLRKFMNMEVTSMLEQVEMDHQIMLSQKDYDYYSLYTETVKSKIKSEKYL